MTSQLACVVLCAGKGTRMKSDLPKVLHPLLGKPLCAYSIERAFELGASPVVAVVGHGAERVTQTLQKAFAGKPLSFALQANQRGTGDAVAQAKNALQGFDGPVLILYGDVPLLTRATLEKLLEAYRAEKGALALLSIEMDHPHGYGRLVRRDGALQEIVEQKDATVEQQAIREVNAGIYVADAKFLFEAVSQLKPQNAQGELYLTDIVKAAARSGSIAVVKASVEETQGINDKAQLADATKVMRNRVNGIHMRNGVTLLDPATTYIEDGVTLGADTVIGPLVSIGAGCVIGANVHIGQGCVLTQSTVHDGAELKPYSVLEEAVVGMKNRIGPFSRLRPGTELAEDVHIGNFVETKKARLGKGTKANHLAYLGDAEIGQGTNVGAGTITCNYDGYKKHLTQIGDNVFIGSDTQLVAPVKVGNGAIIGAGATITENVPDDALALSRAPQVIKEGWAQRRRELLGDKKK
ncbi:MAG: bifunctional UDP-N-acetylglucosamine diphosphorylase/glucosamine-1-phosphate N-acetyltransferase GlmU [Myxococcaceae bacterium]|nr:bifunctional UDP-N-acetylglucosamine diphosphorylase/glucosamine-1-phosphate N-acetyltransferase GlmU [Myxococcaceae bacterium]